MDRGRRSTWTLDDLRRDFAQYSELVNAADLAPTSKTTYLAHADRFVSDESAKARPAAKPSGASSATSRVSSSRLLTTSPKPEPAAAPVGNLVA